MIKLLDFGIIKKVLLDELVFKEWEYAEFKDSELS